MSVWLKNLQNKVVFSESLLKLHCTVLLNLLGAGSYRVNVVCMDAKEIRVLNNRYRNVNHPTDVLSFPFHEVLAL